MAGRVVSCYHNKMKLEKVKERKKVVPYCGRDLNICCYIYSEGPGLWLRK